MDQDGFIERDLAYEEHDKNYKKEYEYEDNNNKHDNYDHHDQETPTTKNYNYQNAHHNQHQNQQHHQNPKDFDNSEHKEQQQHQKYQQKNHSQEEANDQNKYDDEFDINYDEYEMEQAQENEKEKGLKSISPDYMEGGDNLVSDIKDESSRKEKHNSNSVDNDDGEIDEEIVLEPDESYERSLSRKVSLFFIF